MKKLLVFVFVILALPCIVYADPWIVCDPYPANSKPDGFIYTLNTGAEVTIPYAESVRGGVTVAPILDVGPLAEGTHVVSVRPYNIWGSLAPVPFGFTKALPGAMKNMRLSR